MKEWINHTTSAQPVNGNCIVDVKLGNGIIFWSACALDLHWEITGNDEDIVEYRVVYGAEKDLEVDATCKDSNPKDAIGDKKVPMWLLSVIAKAHWAAAQFAGLCKYGAWNWRIAGVRTSTYVSALERHLEAFKNGEDYDPVDGTHHLGNIMACAALLLDAKAANKLTDDRPPKIDFRPAFNEVEKMMENLKELYKDKKPKHWTIEDTK